MDQNFQTSFIPKKPIVKETAAVSRPVGFLLILSLFILFAVLIGTGGLYFYKTSLAKTVTTKEADLVLAKNRFEPKKITELQILGTRLTAANEILSKHITITPVFLALQELTMKTVRYTKFSYDLGTENGPQINIQLSGVAVGYRDLALQADLFATRDIGKNLIDPVFSNLTLDNNGNVLFNLEFSVEPSFVNYKQNLSVENQPN
ncbi:MAG: hypothetical protein WC609_00425 [Candidatus Paceibacterota bacterium]|jgi:hypothetical protein